MTLVAREQRLPPSILRTTPNPAEFDTSTLSLAAPDLTRRTVELESLVNMFAGQDGDKHDIEVSLNDIREWFTRQVGLEREIHELKRTRSEAEAAATLKGYRDGTESVIRQLRAYELNIVTDPIT